MKVGIDGSRLRKPITGVGRYTEGMFASLDVLMPNATFIIYARRRIDIDLPSNRWSIKYDRHPIWSRLPVTYWIHYRLGSIARGDGLDVLWAPNMLLPSTRSIRAPSVITVHDFRHRLAPRDLPPITRRAYRNWADSDIMRADQVIANSVGTSSRALAILGRPADGVALPAVPVRPAVDDVDVAAEVLSSIGIRAPFLLTIGSAPCKNLSSVLGAVERLKMQGKLANHQVAMVGANTWNNKWLNTPAEGTRWIKALGYVDDRTIGALYRLADALVFPSFYEGFGMPVAEAVAAGCRVVTTDSPELHEAGGPDAIYVEPTLDCVADGIEEALKRPTPSHVGLGYDWHSSATVMASAFYRARSRG